MQTERPTRPPPAQTLYTRAALVRLFLLFSAIGLLESLYRYLDYPARGRSINFLSPFIEQMTGCYATLLLLVVLITPVIRRVRPDERPLAQVVPVHLAAALCFSVIHTTLLWGSRAIVFPALGLGPYDYGIVSMRYLMELPTDLISYVVNSGALLFVLRTREASARELQVAQLRAELAQAQLESLAFQLQPHFLFNALNAVSAALYDDPRKADLMLARLADYLRGTLRRSPAQQVPLADELAHLERYLGIMQARFEDNLRLAVTLDEGVGAALVPPLILQPIVENAIHHGFDPHSARIQVEVSATRANGSLVLAIRDHGSGLRADATPRIGLSNTRRRLERLHGDAARIDIANAADGGAEVTIRLPFLTATP